MNPLFLTLDEVLEIHTQQIKWYGGSEGVRDPAGLESAVAGPNCGTDQRLQGSVTITILAVGRLEPLESFARGRLPNNHRILRLQRPPDNPSESRVLRARRADGTQRLGPGR